MRPGKSNIESMFSLSYMEFFRHVIGVNEETSDYCSSYNT